MITKKQYELLLFIDKYIKESGIAPSFDEMKDGLNLKSKSGIHRLVLGLVERKFLRRLENHARALEVIRLPENFTKVEKPIVKVENIGNKAFKHVSPLDNNQIEIPLYGKIAAGTPIEALRDNDNKIVVPRDMIGIGEHYALKVEGDSMEDVGILDGDTVVIKRVSSADNGAIVVALVDGFEVTLKIFKRKGASIVLEPANKRYEPKIFSTERVLVQGILAGLIRSYNFH